MSVKNQQILADNILRKDFMCKPEFVRLPETLFKNIFFEQFDTSFAIVKLVYFICKTCKLYFTDQNTVRT